MYTKLTLRLEEQLIHSAKSFAQDHNKSLSQMVSDYFALLLVDDSGTEQSLEALPPITQSLVGMLSAQVDEDDYYAYLEEKHR